MTDNTNPGKILTSEVRAGDQGRDLPAKWKKSLALAQAASKGTISVDLLSKAKQKWCPKDAFRAEKTSSVASSMNTDGFRGLQSEVILSYEADRHQLLEGIMNVIATCEPRVQETGLEKVHLAFDPLFTRGMSLKRHKGKLNGEAFRTLAGRAFQETYLRFVCEVIAPHIRELMPNEDRIVFQVVLTRLPARATAKHPSQLRIVVGTRSGNRHAFGMWEDKFFLNQGRGKLGMRGGV